VVQSVVPPYSGFAHAKVIGVWKVGDQLGVISPDFLLEAMRLNSRTAVLAVLCSSWLSRGALRNPRRVIPEVWASARRGSAWFRRQVLESLKPGSAWLLTPGRDVWMIYFAPRYARGSACISCIGLRTGSAESGLLAWLWGMAPMNVPLRGGRRMHKLHQARTW